MRIFEIYFKDLTKEAQIRLMETFNTTEGEENWGLIPLAEIHIEEEKIKL